MSSLYELTGQYLEALDFLTDPSNDIDQQTAVDTMESMNGSIGDKMLNVGRVIADMEHQAEGLRSLIKRIDSRLKKIENRSEWLRSYLISAMTQTGKNKVSDADIALSLAKNPPSVIIEDDLRIPDEFKDTVHTVKYDKRAIKQAGGCPGARIVDGGYRVSIK